ncbi:hypothetical protein A3715_05875 [Oleiphilus sp. HI0009]|nr:MULTISPECIES: HlyD family type I secretion periplasmic adaptor subunit [unclassified Oleiphilus]KZX82814.1 hypothetical protein A3715_05875 [Oleiphilus sp. HI0009]MCH2157550.1 HlyD family type I secretion periplasmic adaptor subunit [Oleiphilaceae bacterium]KZY61465.1 hypothetical protein A3738_13960 [Oleiphilus sp. HI0066]KZY67747.1 hypothetical protein A3739_12080 [Oleiphilus sp. HI0067]KZZ59655.1 hypothetical protein A3762_04565 [Oleiphilus sp. HI0125]
MSDIDHKLNQAESLEKQDGGYVTDAILASLHQRPKVSAWILYALSAFFVIALVWAALTNMDEIIRGEAKAIPSASIQKIQNLEGGILEEVMVRDGQLVEKGAVLLVLDDTQASANLIQSETEYLAALAKAARIEAVVNITDPVYHNSLYNKAPQFIDAENQLLEIQLNEHNSNLRIIELEMEEAQQELASANQALRSYQQQLRLSKEQRRINAPLVKQGAVPAIELLNIDQRISELNLEVGRSKSDIPQIKSKLMRLEQKKRAVVEEFRGEAQKELADVRANIEIANADISRRADQQRRTQVTAPITGVIKKVHVSTVGEVVQPGMTMIEIVPADDEIIFETKVRPKDIGFVKVGLPGKIKVSAYEFATYGGLEGVVSNVSADTLLDEKTGTNYYLVKLTVANMLTDVAGNELPIIPGMQAAVDIQVGQKSVLEYFFKPVLRMVKS